MIKDRRLLEEFNRKEYNKKKYSYKDALEIFGALWQEAKSLSILPFKNLFEELDADLRIDRALNYKKKRKI